MLVMELNKHRWVAFGVKLCLERMLLDKVVRRYLMLSLEFGKWEWYIRYTKDKERKVASK